MNELELLKRIAARAPDRTETRSGFFSSPNFLPVSFSNQATASRNSSRVRIRNRCSLSGRPRGYIGRFGVSRITFRELALAGKIPGVTKSSW